MDRVPDSAAVGVPLGVHVARAVPPVVGLQVAVPVGVDVVVAEAVRLGVAVFVAVPVGEVV